MNSTRVDFLKKWVAFRTRTAFVEGVHDDVVLGFGFNRNELHVVRTAIPVGLFVVHLCKNRQSLGEHLENVE